MFESNNLSYEEVHEALRIGAKWEYHDQSAFLNIAGVGDKSVFNAIRRSAMMSGNQYLIKINVNWDYDLIAVLRHYKIIRDIMSHPKGWMLATRLCLIQPSPMHQIFNVVQNGQGVLFDYGDNSQEKIDVAIRDRLQNGIGRISRLIMEAKARYADDNEVNRYHFGDEGSEVILRQFTNGPYVATMVREGNTKSYSYSNPDDFHWNAMNDYNNLIA